MIRCIAIDDEPLALKKLVTYIKKIPYLELVAACHSATEAQQVVGKEEVEAIFLDINMPNLNGLDFAKSLEQDHSRGPIMVFTTAYSEYAVEGYKVNALDYLLKPIKTSELTRALEKFKKWGKADVIAYLEQMMKLRPGAKDLHEYKQSLLISYRDKLLPVNMDDIACIYSTDRKTQVFLKNKKVMDYNRSLDSIIGSLDPARFFRANKQYIVARDCVKEIVIWFDSRLLLKLPIELPEPLFVSKNKASEFKNWMTKI